MNKNTKSKIEEKVFEKISEKHIKPKPRWEFILLGTTFWILGSLTVLLGGMAISASIFVFKNIHWDFYQATHDNLFTFIIDSLPDIWIVLFVLFLIFTNYFIRKTKHGYKRPILMIGGISILISIILGLFFANIGFGKIIEHDFGQKIPFHRNIETQNKILWNNLNKGLLSGEIVFNEGGFALNSSEDKVWTLITEHLDDFEINLLETNKEISLVGIEKENGFYVCRILPLFGKPMGPPGVNELFERKPNVERIKECEGVQPYRRLLNN